MRYYATIIIAISVIVNAEPPRVRLSDGSRLIGQLQTTPEGRTVSEFLGIPFAEPPTGDLRFRQPVIRMPWYHEMEVTEAPNACMQIPDKFFEKDFQGSKIWNPNTFLSEDCLYLNLWVPGNPKQHRKLLPVVVFIYGGAFISGSASLELYNGGTFAGNQDVIFIAMNYRVGVFGFLNLNTDVAESNAGFWDQNLALKWVQRNIRYFGGDPRLVTIFGESAGAASVSAHLISPESRGLFKHAILSSGSIIAVWATIASETSLNASLELAGKVGCLPGNRINIDRERVANCMRKVPTNNLLKASSSFRPTVMDRFIPHNPHEIFKSGPMNAKKVILGTNANEGNYFLPYSLPNEFGKGSGFQLGNSVTSDSKFRKSIEKLVWWQPYGGNKEALNMIEGEYARWRRPTPRRRQEQLDRLIGDVKFTCPTIRQARYHSLHGHDVYTYYMTRISSSSPWPRWMGAIHGDDLMFVFGWPLVPAKRYSNEDRELSLRWMQYYGNFARTG